MKKLLLLLFPLLACAQPSGVQQIIAGGNITLTPNSGRGIVTISAEVSGGSGNVSTNGTALALGNIVVGDGTTIVKDSGIPVANIVVASSATNGQILIGSTATGLFTANVITPGIGIAITNGATAITVNATGNFTTSGTVTTGTVEIGALTDTTLARSAPGNLTVEGNYLYRAGGTDVPVTDGGTGLSAGTSGGVPYFSSTTTIASSAALASGNIVTGGGAGVAPLTVTTGTGVLAALAANVGASGAFVRQTDIADKIAVFHIDGGGVAITTGTVSGTSRIAGNYTLTGYSITGTGATGTNTVKIWYKTNSTAIPTVSDSINTSGVSLTTGTAVVSSSLGDFTTTVFADLGLARCSVTAVDNTATDLTITLLGTHLP